MRTSLNKFAYVLLSIAILSCTKKENQEFQPAMLNSPTVPACGLIELSPPKNIFPFMDVAFTAYVPSNADLSTLRWEISKDQDPVFKSSSQSFIKKFDQANEGSGAYSVTLSFDKGDGNSCALKKSFRVLQDDICVPPSGISGQLVGFVGEETSPFSVNAENCFVGSVAWDMDNNGSFEYEGDVTESFSHVYKQSGVYSVIARIHNDIEETVQYLYHNIEIKGKSCIHPFTDEVIANGAQVEFAKTNPQCGQPCLTAQRTCENGTFIGDTSFTENPLQCAASDACPVEPCTNGATNPPQCNQCPAGQSMVSGSCQTVTYKWQTGEWGQCSAVACGTSGSRSRTVQCVRSDKTIVSDSFCTTEKPSSQQACHAPACMSCKLPWGGTVAHGQKIIAYKASNVACGKTCDAETRTCSNGTLSGSFSKQSCSAAPCAIHALCGSSHGKTFTNAPTTNLCSQGTASGVTSTEQNYNWTCAGQNGGKNANCKAARQHFSTASCGFGLVSSNWQSTPGQPTSSYGSCEWTGKIYLGKSNQVNATFFFGDYYDNSGPYAIFRLERPEEWTITAKGCTLGNTPDPKDYKKAMPNYCRVTDYRSYYGLPLTWSATITATHKVTGETKVMPIRATFKPQIVPHPSMLTP